MQLFKLKEQKILYNYLKQNVGWLCLDPLVKKKMQCGMVVASFFVFEFKFIVEEKNFHFCF